MELKKGQTIMVDANLQQPSSALHDDVSERSGLPAESFELYHGSKRLEGEAVLGSWRVEKDSLIEVKARGRGGGCAFSKAKAASADEDEDEQDEGEHDGGCDCCEEESFVMPQGQRTSALAGAGAGAVWQCPECGDGDVEQGGGGDGGESGGSEVRVYELTAANLATVAAAVLFVALDGPEESSESTARRPPAVHKLNARLMRGLAERHGDVPNACDHCLEGLCVQLDALHGCCFKDFPKHAHNVFHPEDAILSKPQGGGAGVQPQNKGKRPHQTMLASIPGWEQFGPKAAESPSGSPPPTAEPQSEWIWKYPKLRTADREPPLLPARARATVGRTDDSNDSNDSDGSDEPAPVLAEPVPMEPKLLWEFIYLNQAYINAGWRWLDMESHTRQQELLAMYTAAYPPPSQRRVALDDGVARPPAALATTASSGAASGADDDDVDDADDANDADDADDADDFDAAVADADAALPASSRASSDAAASSAPETWEIQLDYIERWVATGAVREEAVRAGFELLGVPFPKAPVDPDFDWLSAIENLFVLAVEEAYDAATQAGASSGAGASSRGEP